MPAPVITAPESVRVIPRGVAESYQLSATNTPNSWTVATGALPTGVTLSNAGLISGTPTTAGAIQATITATNGSGTSAAVTLIYVVLASAAGLPSNSFALALDWDLATDKVSLAGIKSAAPQPAGQPPAAGQTALLVEIKAGQTMALSIGFLVAGTLTDTGIDALGATLKQNEEDTGVAIELDDEDITVTGSGTTTRHEVTVTIPTTGTVATWLADDPSIPALLQLRAARGSETRYSQVIPFLLSKPLGAIPA